MQTQPVGPWKAGVRVCGSEPDRDSRPENGVSIETPVWEANQGADSKLQDVFALNTTTR